MSDKKELLMHLHECLRQEVMMSKKAFSWIKVIHKAIKCPERRFNFWWRVASHLYNTGGSASKKIARRINRKLIQKYNTEIQLPASIGPGLIITHFTSVVINGCAIIGCNFKIRHNCTIGLGGNLDNANPSPKIIIGNNVEVGTGSCILGNDISIGNNVSIGAMSYIGKNIPDNSVVYTEKIMVIRQK